MLSLQFIEEESPDTIEQYSG